MDIKLYDGDFASMENGSLQTIEGAEEILQRCLIRLQVQQGSFLLDKSLGSNLRSLLKQKPAQAQQQAYRLVLQALEPVSEVTVESVDCAFPQEDRMHLDIQLRIGEQTQALQVNF